MCEPNLTNIRHIEIIFQQIHILVYFWNFIGTLYIQTQRTCSMIFFPSATWDEWKPAFRLTKRCLVYGWATKSVSVKTNKQKNLCSAVQRGSNHENMVKKRGQPSTGQKKRTNWQIQVLSTKRNKYSAQFFVHMECWLHARYLHDHNHARKLWGLFYMILLKVFLKMLQFPKQCDIKYTKSFVSLNHWWVIEMEKT